MDELSSDDGGTVPLWVRIPLGSIFALFCTPFVLPPGAGNEEFLQAAWRLAAAGAFAAYYSHRFRRSDDFRRWAGTGGATGLMLGAVEYDLGYGPIWVIPVMGAVGAAIAIGFLAYTEW